MRETAADPLAAFRAVNVDGDRTRSRARRRRRAPRTSCSRARSRSTARRRRRAGRFARAIRRTRTTTTRRASGRPSARSPTSRARRACASRSLRLPLLYGPGAKGNFARARPTPIARGVPLPLGGIDNRRSLLGAGNLAQRAGRAARPAGAAPVAAAATVFRRRRARRCPRPSWCGRSPRALRVDAAAVSAAAVAAALRRARASGQRRRDRAADRFARGRHDARSARASAGRRHGRWRRNWRTWRARGARAAPPYNRRCPHSSSAAMPTRPVRSPRRRIARRRRSPAASRKHAEGSVLVEMGDTRVLCTVSVEEGVPSFLKGKGQGWLTAEYGMLPRATNTRDAPRSGRGQAVRPHAGDPAADRPQPARGDRPDGARRAHAEDRLRRAAGGRRHALRVDHRRVRRGGRRDRVVPAQAGS